MEMPSDQPADPAARVAQLIAGGETIGVIFSSTELYDPVTNSFAALAATPVMN